LSAIAKRRAPVRGYGRRRAHARMRPNRVELRTPRAWSSFRNGRRVAEDAGSLGEQE
jgi:hypothetical protein